MPISEAIPQRKITPEALAFPSGSARARGGGLSTTYQQALNVQIINNISTAKDWRGAIGAGDQRTLSGALRGELRGKHYTADFSTAVRWDIATPGVYTYDAWNVVPYDNENIPQAGANNAGTVGVGGVGWSYTVTRATAGLYFVRARLVVQLPSVPPVDRVFFALWRNGVHWSELDDLDPGYAGENPIRDAKLSGSDLVELSAGDVLSVAVYFDAGGAGGTFPVLSPDQHIGYVSAFRVRCSADTLINHPDPNLGYLFI